MKPKRYYKGRLIIDQRQWFSFVLPDGRTAETLALTREAAKKMIEETLNIRIKEVA